MIRPSSIITTRSAAFAREAHLVRDDDHRHAVAGELLHHLEHLADHLRVERARRLVEEHQRRLHGQRARDRDALLLAAGELARVDVALVGEPDPREQPSAARRLRLRQSAHADRRLDDVLERGHVREEVEALEDEADLLALAGDVLLRVLDSLPFSLAGSRSGAR